MAPIHWLFLSILSAVLQDYESNADETSHSRKKKTKTKKHLTLAPAVHKLLVVIWQFFRAAGAESGGKHRCPPQAMCKPSTSGNACFSCSSPWGLNWSAPKRIEVSLFLFFLSLKIRQQLTQNLKLFLTGVRDDTRTLKAKCVPCKMGERGKKQDP